MAITTFRQVAVLLGGAKSVRAMAAAEGLVSLPFVSLRYLLSYRPPNLLPTFRQLSTLLGGTNSMRTMAAVEGIAPGTRLSMRKLLSHRPVVISIPALPQTPSPRTKIDTAYVSGPPSLLDAKAGPPVPDYFPPASMDDNHTVISTDGRVSPALRAIAQLRNGKAILLRVAELMAAGTEDQATLTAMTQLAATGSQAYATRSTDIVGDVTSHLLARGVSASAAASASNRIKADFDAAVTAVRRSAGTMRDSMKGQWIAVSGEDDPPDFPVNVPVTPHPQYHFDVSVPTPQGKAPAQPVRIRYTIASQNTVRVDRDTPFIPSSDEVVLYIHGEGSKAEEADDFIPQLFALAKPTSRSFTVVAFDQPSCGYSTMVSHLDVAPMPPTQSPPLAGDYVDFAPYGGSPILDFVEQTIVAFVEQCILPFGAPITAIVGGSLGGHMALRLAASGKTWVRNVIAWSPASVMDHDCHLRFDVAGDKLDVSFPQRVITNPKTSRSATDVENSEWDSRADFFNTVWFKDTFNPNDYKFIPQVAAALIAAGVFIGPVAALVLTEGAAVVEAVLADLETVPPQPHMWYRSDWESTPAYVSESRLDRREIYNDAFRRWHWRICQEMVGFKFDSLTPAMTKPLLLMVGEDDEFPQVHFFSNVRDFRVFLQSPAQGVLTVRNTGHSIHNEQPAFLARQVLNFASHG